jgi:carboxymethylenebutenolidase
MNETSMRIITETLSTPSGMPVYVARPETGRAPVFILMHERYGLVRHTRDLAERCARDGYFVLAPNFFFRHPDPARLNAGDSRYDLTDPESVELIGEAVALARGHANADGSRIAVAGYCQTGRHPLVYAAQAPVQAVVVWYGAASRREWDVTDTQPQPLQDLIAKAPCPVFGAFGAEDHIISIDDIHVYAGAPHGWLNDTMPGRYRKPQADAAWAAQQAFLKSVFAEAPSLVRWNFSCDFAPDYDFSKNKRLE